jgi:hypothetical protein
MYTVKIDISDWGNEEFVTIETGDFDKVQLIQEFIEFQRENGWAADYEHVVEFDEEEDAEDAEDAEDEEVEITEDDEVDEPMTVSTYIITKIED